MPRCRPFTIADGMILVAAAALTVWLARAEREWDGRPLVSWEDFKPSVDTDYDFSNPYLNSVTGIINRVAVPFILPASLAMLAIRLRRPRPILRRLGRQPGFAATAAVALIFALNFASRVIDSHPRFIACARTAFGPLSEPLGRFEPTGAGGAPIEHSRLGLIWYCSRRYLEYLNHHHVNSLWWFSSFAGAAVAAAWFVMILGRAWRREPGWIDLAGTAVGCLWILAFLAWRISYSPG